MASVRHLPPSGVRPARAAWAVLAGLVVAVWRPAPARPAATQPADTYDDPLAWRRDRRRRAGVCRSSWTTSAPAVPTA